MRDLSWEAAPAGLAATPLARRADPTPKARARNWADSEAESRPAVRSWLPAPVETPQVPLSDRVLPVPVSLLVMSDVTEAEFKFRVQARPGQARPGR